MCLVVPAAIAAGLSAAQSVVGYIGQSQQAAQQANYQNAVYRQQQADAVANAEYQNRQVTRNNQYIQDNAENTKRALQLDREALVAQERQQGIATALEIESTRIQRLRAQGAIQASERSGVTIENLLRDYDRQDSISSAVMAQNLRFANEQRQRQSLQLGTQAQSRINQARPYEAAPFATPTAPTPVQGPSLLSAAISGVSSAASVYSNRTVYNPSTGSYTIDSVSNSPSSFPSTPSPGEAWINDVKNRF